MLRPIVSSIVACVPYFNGGLTLLENGLNLVGYFNSQLAYRKVRLLLALFQTAMGALFMVSGHWLTTSVATQVISLGELYLTTGFLNGCRAWIESYPLASCFMFAYDFYGRKLSPPLNRKFDLLEKIFERIRAEMDRIHYFRLFPLTLSRRI